MQGNDDGARGPVGATGRPRRTQAERRASTRAALVQATIDELFEVGFARASTVEIANRAGVSQGSVFRHFPTKDDLFVGTFEDIVRHAPDLVEHLIEAPPEGADAAGRLRHALQGLYDGFLTPPLVAVTELQVGARTRPELAERLSEVLGAHWLDIGARAAPWFEDLAHRPDFPQILGTVIDTVRGYALSKDTEEGIFALFPGAPDMLDVLADLLVRAYLR